MSTIIRLQGSPGGLRIEIADNGWGRCILTGEQEIVLGADMISIVSDRILRGLRGIRPTPSHQTTEVLGRQAFSAMLLSEAHHCLWVANETQETHLIWQNINHEQLPYVGSIRLTNDDIARWIDQLLEIESKLWGTEAWLVVPEQRDL